MSNTPPRPGPFPPGRTVMLREIVDGKVWGAQPVIIVRDTPELTAFYLPDGAVTKMPTRPDGSRIKPADRLASRWELRDRDWNRSSYLRLNLPGAPYSVLLFRRAADKTFAGWYINLEEPLRRVPSGFEFLDQWLDVIIEPDLSAWRRKDEDEFREAIDLGLISPEQAAALCGEGERAARWIQSGKSPFNAWVDWRPDPGWRIPVLPEGWDKVV